MLAVASSGYDRDEFLFLDQIEVGMTGMGKTIVADDVISEFEVEIIGIIDQPGDLSDFIAVRASGQPIGQYGGIAQGMSGSPIYVEGKLIGALSRTGAWSKEIVPIALITPIEPMLAVLDSAMATLATPNADALLEGVAVVETTSLPSSDLVASQPSTLFAVPVSTPIVTAGLSERAQSVLMDGFSAQLPFLTIDKLLPNPMTPVSSGLRSLGTNLIPAAGDGGLARIDPAALEPGSSIGVALATGDVSIGALGTLTYREGDALIGFGHRFLYNGPSSFAMTTVSIIDTMKSLEASYKLGMLGETIGTISEDRIAAIAGRIGDPFAGIDVAFDILDMDTGLGGSYAIGLVDEPRLVPELLLSTGFEAIDSTLDRVGQGTVVVTYTIDGDGMPQSLERTDTFFSSSDIAVYPPLQVASIVSALQYNEFADPEITSVEATMEFTEEIRGIRISDLSIDFSSYEQGETIRFELTLQTYQGDVRIEEGEITIPADLLSDQIILRAYGGPRYLESGEKAQVFTGLDDLIGAIETFPGYQTLTVELFAVDPFALHGDGLYGVDEVTFHFPGYVVYGEREASALLLFADSGWGSD